MVEWLAVEMAVLRVERWVEHLVAARVVSLVSLSVVWTVAWLVVLLVAWWENLLAVSMVAR